MSRPNVIFAGESLLYDMEFVEPPLRAGESITSVVSVDITPPDDLTVTITAAAGQIAQFRIEADGAAAEGERAVVVTATTDQGSTVKGKGVLEVVTL